MSVNLIDYLQDIKDFRSSRGKRYELWVILLLIIMSNLSGYHNYCALEHFSQRHYLAINEKLGLNLNKAPSDTTFRRIFHSLNFQVLAEQFHNWMEHYIEIEPQEWLSIDGKSIKGTVNDFDKHYQNFVSLVSVYSHSFGVVVALKQFENKKDSEIKVVQYLLEILHLEEVVFTLDGRSKKNNPVNY